MTGRDGHTHGSDASAREVLASRARALARPREEPGAEQRTVELVSFSRARAAYAISAADVLEVVPLVAPTRVPGTPPAVLGVVNHRGRILAVVDVRRLLGAAEGSSEEGYLVVVRAGEASFAVRSDSVPEVVTVAEEDVLPAGGLVEEQDSVIRGVTRSMVAVIDVEAIAGDPRIAVDDEVE